MRESEDQDDYNRESPVIAFTCALLMIIVVLGLAVIAIQSLSSIGSAH